MDERLKDIFDYLRECDKETRESGEPYEIAGIRMASIFLSNYLASRNIERE